MAENLRTHNNKDYSGDVFASANSGDISARETLNWMGLLEYRQALSEDRHLLEDHPTTLPPSQPAVPESEWTRPEYWR